MIPAIGTGATAAELSAPQVLEDYQRLIEWQFQAAPIPVPEGGIDWSEGTASWHLESGQLWLQRPTSDGTVTGFVFEGRGRFRMTVPDPFELAQLRRFARRPELEEIDEPFTRLVRRSSEGLPSGIPLPPETTRYTPHKLAGDRHDIWLRAAWHDADARIIAALHTPGDRYGRTAMKTESFDWLMLDYDAERPEEIRLDKFVGGALEVYESWLSLAETRDPRGRPASTWRPDMEIRHVDLAVDLTEPGRDAGEVRAEIRATLHFTPVRVGARALRFHLAPLAEVRSVTDEQDRALPFIRFHLGGHSSAFDRRLYDNALVVLLPEPVLGEGERRLRFEYAVDMRNYAAGRSWYPACSQPERRFQDVHTVALELTARKSQEVRAMGTRKSERSEDKRVVTRWEVSEPVKMMTFVFASRYPDGFHEERLEVEGAPKIVCFGPKAGLTTKNKFFNVGADVANSINYFQQLFASPLAAETIYATGIESNHGQAFEGFLHLGQISFMIDHPGATQLFRSHEVAHQWWGHKVGWRSYRDQWLSEALAEYSAMLFVEATEKDGAKYYRQIVDVYSAHLQGSLKDLFSKFARPWMLELNPVHIGRIGPIGHGRRAATMEVPQAYFNQVYIKGALVFHMLRSLLRSMTKSDETFVAVLRDFAATYDGRDASTEDFQAILTKHAPTDWSWFFDQWIYGSGIPTYTWSYRVGRSQGGESGYGLIIKVAQSGVPEGFKMPVPVRIEFAGGRVGELLFMVDQPRKSLTVPVPEKPKDVIFNPDRAVLAKVKKE